MPSSPAPILLLAALRDELAPTLQALNISSSSSSSSSSATLSGKKIIAIVTGMGPARMVAAAAQAIDLHRPSRLILLGFSGGLDPSLPTGHVIDARAIVNSDGQRLTLTSSAPPTTAANESPNPLTTLLTTEQIICDPAQKKSLGQLHRAAAVDLESFALARLAADGGLPLTILRAISDTADAALPADISQWVKVDGSPSVMKVLGSLIRRPSILGTLLRLQRDSKLAAQQLAVAVQANLRNEPRP